MVKTTRKKRLQPTDERLESYITEQDRTDLRHKAADTLEKAKDATKAFTKMVQVDSRTWVFVPEDKDPIEVIEKYKKTKSF